MIENLIADKISKDSFYSLVKEETEGLEENTKELLNNLAEDIVKVNKEKEDYLEQNKKMIYKILLLLGEMSEYRDDVTGAHINRVSKVARILGDAIIDDQEELIMLENAAKLHDLGKIAIPDSILLKPGKLTKEEFAQMQEHCQAGYNIISKIEHPLFEMASSIALTHHEKWDGTGYPLGLEGNDIPYESRIVAICDVFDALKSERPYKKAFTFEQAFNIITQEKGKQFDPQLVDIFIENKENIINIYKGEEEGIA
ncbi:HD-GYP domain-containing protein [Orenia marismortui]|uniref:HD domain-containing protein n=1 Tax=Orenia marismortui TaxID=46469 RepID=A0A4R8H289_9FIRM|nr:HD domain-containing phosphohydrolase [Orenia marismortui]TDX49211.1 HD domain-containing protein [Orenia marismortui]